MDRLWSPWRSEYIASASSEEPGAKECLFCGFRDNPDGDETNFVVHRAANCFVVLNRYPYTSGHLLIVPNEHVSEIDLVSKESSDELMDLTKRCQTALRDAYQPAGFNIGINVGRAAGAGITDHVHIHILPRWAGDTNFMTTVAEARVLPEDLATTYSKLRGKI